MLIKTSTLNSTNNITENNEEDQDNYKHRIEKNMNSYNDNAWNSENYNEMILNKFTNITKNNQEYDHNYKHRNEKNVHSCNDNVWNCENHNEKIDYRNKDTCTNTIKIR